MPKEKPYNPVQAQHKSDKAKALKKSKAQQQSQRNEKLARRNPERLQRQLDDLRALESSGQPLRPKDKQTLEQLEKDLKAVKRAREALGDKAPSFGRGNGPPRDDHHHSNNNNANGATGTGSNHLGKRRRRNSGGDSDTTDEDVRSIPMPRDTPPPIPRRKHNQNRTNDDPNANGGTTSSNAPAAQITYSSAPVMRDLAKEARRFVPAAVAQNLARQKGQDGHRLLEPEEMDRLERAGYGDTARQQQDRAGGGGPNTGGDAAAASSSGLRTAALRDAERAAGAGEEEDELEMLLAEVGEGVEDRTGMADVARSGMEDAQKAAAEAEKEAEFLMIAHSKGKVGTGDAERELRRVELEEVEDEDL